MFMAHSPDYKVCKDYQIFLWGEGAGVEGGQFHVIRKIKFIRWNPHCVVPENIHIPTLRHRMVRISWGWRVLEDQNIERNASSLEFPEEFSLPGKYGYFLEIIHITLTMRKQYIIMKDLGEKHQVVRVVSNYGGTCCWIFFGWNLVCNSFLIL